MQKEECLQLQKALRHYLDYAEALDVSVESGIPLAPPITGTLTITSRCNSDCVYCHFRKSLSNKNEDSDSETLKRIIREMAVIGVKILTLTGGEPLLRKDLPELCACARDEGMTVHITTNGLLLTHKIAARLSESGVSNLVMSLDSFDNSVYSGHRGVSNKKVVAALEILDAFTRMKEENMCAVTFVVSKKNYRELPGFVRHLKTITDRVLINIQPYNPPTLPETEEQVSLQELTPQEADRGPMTDMIETLIAMKQEGSPINNSDVYLRHIPAFLIDRALPEGPCWAGYSGVYVQDTLNLLPCWKLPPVGNLKQKSLVDLWFSQKYSHVRHQMVRQSCPRCMLLCHNEPGWYGWYNRFYKQ